MPAIVDNDVRLTESLIILYADDTIAEGDVVILEYPEYTAFVFPDPTGLPRLCRGVMAPQDKMWLDFGQQVPACLDGQMVQICRS